MTFDGRFTYLVAQFILTTIHHDKGGLNLHLLENYTSDPHLMSHQ